MMDAILVERDYKGIYERFALTPEEFEKEFPETVAKGEWPVISADSDTIAPLVHIWFCPAVVGSEEWNDFFTDMTLGLPESDIESGNLAYIREDLFQSLKEYLPVMKAINIKWDIDSGEEYDEDVELPNEIVIPKGMTDEDEISDYISDFSGFCHDGFELVVCDSKNIEIEVYPNLSVCTDFEYLKENLSEKALDELERIIDAYSKGKIDIELVRNENDELDYDASFGLIINDKDYKESGCERLALKWYEDFEDTGYLVDCFKDAFTENFYHFTVDYNENGQKKSFEINVSSNEKPDNKWLAEKIKNYFSAHYNGSVEKALNSVEGIDVQVTDFRGEYVDSDEVFGDDLKALFEHLKTERYKLFVDDEVHYAMLTISEVNRINKDIAGELNCQFVITDENGEKIESGIIDFIEKDEDMFYFCPETVTGYIGQILDECEIDEKARGLLSELYNGALKELNGDELEKPGLDDVISAAKQRQNNTIDKNSPSVEPER